MDEDLRVGVVVGNYLSTEGAGVFGVLGDFHFFDHLTKRGTISGAVLAGDSDLLGALSLKRGREEMLLILG